MKRSIGTFFFWAGLLAIVCLGVLSRADTAAKLDRQDPVDRSSTVNPTKEDRR